MGTDAADPHEPEPDAGEPTEPGWSFDDAWSAISGRAGARADAALQVSIDVSDGQPVHEHLARIVSLLADHNVLVSAASVAVDLDEASLGVTDGIVQEIQWNIATDVPPVATDAERGAGAAALEFSNSGWGVQAMGASMARLSTEGVIPAFMLEPGYERALDAAIWSGSNRVSTEFGTMLADQIMRTLRTRSETDAPPALVLPPRLAEAVGTLLPREVPGLVVLGYDAIPDGAQVECVEMLRCPVPPYAAPDAGLTQHMVEVRPEDLGEAADWNW